MKIGIFTYFQTNYGAVLQAYALQKYLQNQPGTEVEIIDFTTPEHLEGHKICKKQSLKNPVAAIAYYFFTLIHYRQLKRRVIRTWDFKNKYFKFSQRYSSMKDALENHPKEDIYITGSDQVFNPSGKYVPLYYLGFDKGNGKKVAYAPSFGISKFDDSITHKNYIFIYDLNGAESLISIAKKIQKDTRLPIVCLTRNRLKMYPINKQIYDAGPAEFVGWIKNASYVVTDSFHGTVFSLIFSKQFFTYIALERTSSRIRNILGKAGLENRIVTKEGLKLFDFLSYERYASVDLQQLSASSKQFIHSVL